MGEYDNKEEREKNDFYATKPNEVRNILDKEDLYGNILENSCGEGHIAEVVKENYPDNRVITTDLVDRGYGETGLDFLSDNYPYEKNIDTVIMNPPFSLIEEFVLKSLRVAKKKVVLLARIQFVQSISRYKNIFSTQPSTRIWFYVDRGITAKGANFDNYKSPSMSFAWYIWDWVDDKKNFGWIRRYDKKD